MCILKYTTDDEQCSTQYYSQVSSTEHRDIETRKLGGAFRTHAYPPTLGLVLTNHGSCSAGRYSCVRTKVCF